MSKNIMPGELFITIGDVDNSFLPKNIFIPKNSVLMYVERINKNNLIKEKEKLSPNVYAYNDLLGRHKMLFKKYVIYVTDYSFQLYYRKL